MSLTPAQRREVMKLVLDSRSSLRRSIYAERKESPEFEAALKADEEAFSALVDKVDALTEWSADTVEVPDAAHPLAPFCPKCGIQPSRFTGCECGKEARP